MVLNMVFANLEFWKVRFDKIHHTIEHKRIVVRIVRDQHTADPRGLPDILQSYFGDRNVEFLMQASEQRLKKGPFLFKRFAAWQDQFNGTHGDHDRNFTPMIGSRHMKDNK
jgi:hypothetical protein